MVVWLYAWMPHGGGALLTAWKTENRESLPERTRARSSIQEQTPTSSPHQLPIKSSSMNPSGQQSIP